MVGSRPAVRRRFDKKNPKPREGEARDFPARGAEPGIASNAAPTIVVAPRGADRLKSGHLWVYRSDVISANGVAPGAVVPVDDHRGKFLGTALYSSSSQIAVRLLAREPIDDFPALLRRRIQDAATYRSQVVRDSDAYRVVFSEGDLLPGLIVDRYRDVLSVQILTQAMDAAPVRKVLLEELTTLFQPAGITERVDARVRELEQLPEKPSGLLVGDRGHTVFAMNGVRFHFDALEGQKTGAFLDQRENYAAAAEYAHGEALDVFCYQGGFALHLAKKAAKVSGVDSSRPALEVADRNALLNQHEIEWITSRT